MKTIRKKIAMQKLETQLQKYERRIQKMAYNAYQIRQLMEQLSIKEKANAIRETGTEGTAGNGVSNRDAGELKLPDNAIVDPILEEQSDELSID